MHPNQELYGLPKLLVDDNTGTGQNTNASSQITLSPLPPGYAITLGNALRRTLLSTLPGYAVVGVKIKGMNYEYSTIEGAHDSVLEMLLNLKQLRIKSSASDSLELKLKVNKAGDVLAKLIECPSNVEIINQDLYITHLEKGSELEMTILCEKNVGYQTAKEKQESSDLTDWIWIDAFFSPVRKVKFSSDNTRVGQMTNLDKLMLDVETDGSITPLDAVRFASNMLQSYFKLFNEDKILIEPDFMSDIDSVEAKEKAEIEAKPVKETYTPIEVLGLSPRTLNACINGDIGSVEQLVKCSEAKLSNLRGFGKKALTEVREALGTRGLDLAED